MKIQPDTAPLIDDPWLEDSSQAVFAQVADPWLETPLQPELTSAAPLPEPPLPALVPPQPLSQAYSPASPRRQRWRRALAASAIALLLLVPLLQRPPRDRRPPDLEATTLTLQPTTLSLRVEGSGSVVAIDTANLSPKTTGRLEALMVQQGDRVQAGQVLARMQAGTLPAERQQSQAQLAQAEADYAQVLAGSRQEAIDRAEAEVAAAEAQVALASTQRDRYERLAERGAISRNELDQYRSEARSAAAALAQAQAQRQETASGSRPETVAAAAAAVAAAKARVAIIDAQIAETLILAPFSGIVTQTYATEGAIVTPTTSASATVSATSSSILALSAGLEIEAKVSEANIGQVAVGQTVEIVADAFPQQTFQGKVSRIAPEALIENNVTVFQVGVELVTGLDQLRSGMTVNTVFVGDTLTNALVVPTVAIATESGQLGVRIADDQGNPVFQPITVGLTQAGSTQVLTGLTAGDRVFLSLPQGSPSAAGLPLLP